MKPLNNGHARDPAFYPCRELILFREVILLYIEGDLEGDF